jgi:hypothetical protein
MTPNPTNLAERALGLSSMLTLLASDLTESSTHTLRITTEARLALIEQLATFIVLLTRIPE